MSRNRPNLDAIERHIEAADDGDLGLVGLANSINAAIIESSGLSTASVEELRRLKRLAIDKACGATMPSSTEEADRASS